MCRSGRCWRNRQIVDTVLDAGGFLHGFTYAGNPLACAAGLAVIEEIARHGMMETAIRTGAVLRDGLAALAARFPFVGEVRGMGLLAGDGAGGRPRKPRPAAARP